MCGVLHNGTSDATQVSSARSPGSAGWIANEKKGDPQSGFLGSEPKFAELSARPQGAVLRTAAKLVPDPNNPQAQPGRGGIGFGRAGRKSKIRRFPESESEPDPDPNALLYAPRSAGPDGSGIVLV
jgi:hypothetical protein